MKLGLHSLAIVPITVLFVAALATGATAAPADPPPDGEMPHDKTSNRMLPADAIIDPTAIAKADWRELALVTVERAAAAKYASIFGGLAYDDDETSLTVYVTGHDMTFEKFMAEQLKPTLLPVWFASTPNSIESLNSVNQAITSAALDLQKQGIVIAASGPDIRQGLVVAEVIDMSAEQEAVLVEQFGAAATFTSISKDAAPIDFDRHTDSAPWNAGDVTSSGFAG